MPSSAGSLGDLGSTLAAVDLLLEEAGSSSVKSMLQDVRGKVVMVGLCYWEMLGACVFLRFWLVIALQVAHWPHAI